MADEARGRAGAAAVRRGPQRGRAARGAAAAAGPGLPRGGCGWLFLDESGRRRWCSLRTCGGAGTATH
ncbi:CGNR zinc finger domain-containing protein [Streptomyces zhihengii]